MTARALTLALALATGAAAEPGSTPEAAPATTAPATTPVTASPSATGTLFHRASGRWRLGRVLGSGTAAAGVVLLGVAGGFGFRALGLHDEERRACPAQPCLEPSAYDFYEQARRSQNLAVALASAGAALAAAGALLFVLDPGGQDVHLAAAALPGWVALTFGGAF